MGVLNAAGACGALAGSLLGPALWTLSLRIGPGNLWLLAGGRLPFFVTGCLLSASLVLLRIGAADPSRPVGKVAVGDGGAMPSGTAGVGGPAVNPSVLGTGMAEPAGAVETASAEGEDRELLA
mmetsp:Transcript_84907/g.263719  ORF Transcript_84907/g.263719 Transcript_84907/m.263719 type:complete len:123 (-) Transcript_84907:227-595(-)